MMLSISAFARRREQGVRPGAVVLAAMCVACTPSARSAPADDVSGRVVVGARNFLTGYDTANDDGTYNLVVEIPTGTSEKWEICAEASLLAPEKFPGCTAPGREIVHEARSGTGRVIRHIGYPGNYGALPRTLSGDGDPIDVIAVGPAARRGDVLRVKVVGVFRCLDGGEQDDKLIAISQDSPLFAHPIEGAADLNAVAPNAADILFRWFTGYKGDASMVCTAMEDAPAAARLIAEARAAFAAR